MIRHPADLRRAAARGPFLHTMQRLFTDRRGGVLAYIALIFPVLMGFAGLAVDVSTWYSHKRHAQTMVDAAALAGAQEAKRGGSFASVQAVATDNAEQNGFDAPAGQALAVYWPPASGPFAGDAGYVEVVADYPAETFFSRFFVRDLFDVKARAVAGVRVADGCLWALSPDERGALTITGTSDVSVDCDIRVNSDDPEAMRQQGDSCVHATGYSISGGYTGSCVYPEPVADTGSDYYDPLSHVDEPAYGGCDSSERIHVRSGEVRDLAPGVYCGNITVNADGRLNLVKGPYDDWGLFVLDRAGLDVAANATVSGEDVVIFMDNTRPAEALNIQGQAIVTLSAPSSGPYAGILFWQSGDTPSTVKLSVTGGASMHLDGVIYAPSTETMFAGESATGGGVIVIADTITIAGTTSIGSVDGPRIGANAAFSKPVLVE